MLEINVNMLAFVIKIDEKHFDNEGETVSVHVRKDRILMVFKYKYLAHIK